MAFDKEICDILVPFVDNYKEAGNEIKRKAVIKNATEAVRKSRESLEDQDGVLPKNLPLAITRYIKGLVANEEDSGNEEPKPKKRKQVYTIRDVIKQNYSKLVDDEIPFNSSEKEYLGCYQRAVTTVLNNMGEEELEEAENILGQWNANGAPSHLQIKRARTKLPKDIKKKLEEWRFESGAELLCLVAYSDGSNVQTFHMESIPVAGTRSSFTQSCPDWREGTYDNFKGWALKHFGMKETDSDEEADVPVHFKKAKNIEFEKNSKGHFILPGLENYRTTRQRQRVVRGYIGAVYREFTGNNTAAFPYILASKEDQAIYSIDCVPGGFSLSDPDHLPAFKINTLYHHWLTRQSKRLPPFIVLNPGPLHSSSSKKSEKAKGKKKIEYKEVSSDGGEEEEQERSDRDKGESSFPLAAKCGPPIWKPSGDDGEEEEQERSDRDEEESSFPLPAKYGPPIGKPKKAMANIDSRNAGPSSSVAKGRNGKDADGRTPEVRKTRNSSKRKRGDDEAENPLKKRSKPDDGKRPGRKTDILADDHEKPIETGKKRKRNGDDQEKAGAKKPIPKQKDPPLSPTSPVKHREPSRLKEFPAGNAATSTSRMAFIRSLCRIPKFLSLADSILVMPRPSPIPKEYPSWASWKSKEVYLPPDFHRSRYFDSLLAILERDLGNPKVLEEGKIDAPLLLLGLMHREVSRSMEVEPGAPSKHPEQVVASKFGIKEVRKIERLLNGLSI